MTLLVTRVRAQRLARAVAFAVALGIPVAALAYAVRAQVTPVVAFDEAAVSAATAVTREDPALRGALLAWQEAFQAKWVNLAVTLLCVWVWRRPGLRSRALWAFVTLMTTWALGLGAKYVVQRSRPMVEDAVAHAPGYSFPSGHAMNTAAAGVTLTLLVWPLLGRRGRAVTVTVVTAAVLLTGADRVMLGVHYPSDVVAGFLLGSAMAGASYLGWTGWNPVHHHDDEKGGPS